MNRQPLTRLALMRLLDTRRRIEASRASRIDAVIRQQLVATRRSYPA